MTVHACVCVGEYNSSDSILCKCTQCEWVFKSTLTFFCAHMCLLINGNPLLMFFIMTLFMAHILWLSSGCVNCTCVLVCVCVCRTEDVSPVGDRLLSTEEQVTLITESMTVTSTDQEKLLLLNKNTELRRVNKEVQYHRKPVQILYRSTFVLLMLAITFSSL